MRRRILALLCIATLLTCVFGIGEIGYAASGDSPFLDLGDIGKNPGKYFDVSYNIGYPNSNVKIGLNFGIINDFLKNINYPLKDTSYNKVHITNFKINKVDLNSIYFKAEIRIRKYEKFLGKMVKLLDRTASADIRLDYYFDTKDNSLNFKKVKASNINLERKLQDYLIGGVTAELIAQVIENNMNINISLNERIPLDFLNSKYFKTPKLYTEGNFLYMDFTIDSRSVLDDFLKIIKGYKINVRNVTPTANPPKERILIELPAR